MNIELSKRRMEVIRQALIYQIERYERGLSLHPRNTVLLEACSEVRSLLEIIEQRLSPLPAIEEVI
jgi:hypothetical protein